MSIERAEVASKESSPGMADIQRLEPITIASQHMCYQEAKVSLAWNQATLNMGCPYQPKSLKCQ